ncbi:hypothetical protein N7G274_010189 [Stereocaulon virgatum]|uniref:Uncharacterized protein n=1 Tax=Stereocaulon virgatum TaxID=373712 RepID=A0ABR3ZU27_9LECA
MSETIMDSIDARHASFINWPPAGRLDPPRMAATGFYQQTLGSDAVSCFNCNVSMGNWNDVSDLIMEHQSALVNYTWNNGTYMITVKERLGSFHTWPIGIKPLLIAIALVGVYHSNKMTDSVTCFCRNLALRFWKKNDGPV